MPALAAISNDAASHPLMRPRGHIEPAFKADEVCQAAPPGASSAPGPPRAAGARINFIPRRWGVATPLSTSTPRLRMSIVSKSRRKCLESFETA